MTKLTIITPYTHPSACGIWKRAYDDVQKLGNDAFDITFISSNIEKGTENILPAQDSFNHISLIRKNVFLEFTGTSMFFWFFRDLKILDPDIIHTHGYRHPHSLQALIWGKLKGKKVIITPHAPFQKDTRRSLFAKLIDIAYDLLIGWWELKLYDKIILTTKWEKQSLKRRGATEKQLIFAPNGISDEYFKDSVDDVKKNRTNSMLGFYMGRLDPVKRVEWVVGLAKELKDYVFTIYGPLSGYSDLISRSGNLTIKKEKYNSDDFIKEARKHSLYIMPSIRESFGMTMLEAMSQGCVVLSTKTKGASEIIVHGKNGLVFESEEELLTLTKQIISGEFNLETLSDNAFKTAEKFRINKTQKIMENLYKNL